MMSLEEKRRRREAQARWLAKPGNREKKLACRRAYKLSPAQQKRKNEQDQANHKKHPEVYRRHKLKSKYGLTPEQWEAMFNTQSRCCAICFRNQANWDTDHDHETGMVRGILCHQCNLGLGAFKDSSIALRRAALYLDGAGQELGHD